MATRPPPSTRAQPPSAHGTPRPDRQMAILLAAEKLFSQRGYHGVTIRQIAEEAGVPLALVGYYYGPKHDLFHAIFVHWQATAEQRLTLLDEVIQSPGKRDRLRQVVEALLMSLSQPPSCAAQALRSVSWTRSSASFSLRTRTIRSR